MVSDFQRASSEYIYIYIKREGGEGEEETHCRGPFQEKPEQSNTKQNKTKNPNEHKTKQNKKGATAGQLRDSLRCNNMWSPRGEHI